MTIDKFKGRVKLLRLKGKTIPANKIAKTVKAYEDGFITLQKMKEECIFIMQSYHKN